MDAAIPQPMQTVLELKNEERAGLGLALPAGDVVVFTQDGAGPPVLIGQPSMRDTAKDLPFELNLAPSTMTRVVSGLAWIRSIRSGLIANWLSFSLVTTIMASVPGSGRFKQPSRPTVGRGPGCVSCRPERTA